MNSGPNAPDGMHEVRVSKLAVNFVGVLLAIALMAGFIVLARLLPHYVPPRDFDTQALFSDLFVFIGALVVLIVLHEALHGVGMRWFGGVPRSAVHFGIMWKALIPYCHCRVPLTVRACRRMALLPLWVTGGTALAALMVRPTDDLGALAGITLAACVGDVWMVWRLRPFAENWLVRDSPTEIGCDVFPPGTEWDVSLS